MELNGNGVTLSDGTTAGFDERVKEADRVLIFKDVHWLQGRNVSPDSLLFGKTLATAHETIEKISNCRTREFSVIADLGILSQVITSISNVCRMCAAGDHF
eukprot:COSAG02_NODE_2586_length_8475_cov_96.509193_6_plen_101_part_00